jgi:thymidylate synthase
VGAVKDKEAVQRQRVMVFQQNGSGNLKIEGLRKYGGELFALEVIAIDLPLPAVIDDTRVWLPEHIDADLVLDFLRHGDLSSDLATLCARCGVPMIASGKKSVGQGALTPPTCCGLPRHQGLGNYGEHFGAPEFAVKIADGKIAAVEVLRGAPCGATWAAAERLIGHPATDAARRIGLETQFYCYANPAGWDPIHGKSPVHFAGKIHSQQLAKAIEMALSQP